MLAGVGALAPPVPPWLAPEARLPPQNRPANKIVDPAGTTTSAVDELNVATVPPAARGLAAVPSTST